MAKIFYTLITLISALGLLFFTYTFLYPKETGPRISFEYPSDGKIGIPTDFKIKIRNTQGSALDDARLGITLKGPLAFSDKPVSDSLFSKKIGTLGLGSEIEEVIPLIALFSEDNSVPRLISIALDYSTSPGGTRFSKNIDYTLPAVSSPLSLSLSFPESVTSGHSLDTKIAYENISDTQLPTILLRLLPSPFFRLEKNSLIDEAGDSNEWSLGALSAKVKDNFTVMGKVSGPENQFFDINLEAYSVVGGERYLIGKSKASSTIAISPISLTASVNNLDFYPARLGDTLTYLIHLDRLNNSETRGTLTITLDGELFDLPTLTTNQQGEVNFRGRSGNKLTFDVASGVTRTALSFSLKLKNSIIIRRFADKNYSVKAIINYSDNKNSSELTKEVKVGGALELSPALIYRDASSGIINKGPFPPKSGLPTEYSLHLGIKNTISDLGNINVLITLPESTEYIENRSLPETASVIYDAPSRMLKLTLDRVSAGRGYLNTPFDVIFRLRHTPEEAEIGSYAKVVNSLSYTAEDTWTSAPISGSLPLLTTELPLDSTVKKREGQVLR